MLGGFAARRSTVLQAQRLAAGLSGTLQDAEPVPDERYLDRVAFSCHGAFLARPTGLFELHASGGRADVWKVGPVLERMSKQSGGLASVPSACPCHRSLPAALTSVVMQALG